MAAAQGWPAWSILFHGLGARTGPGAGPVTKAGYIKLLSSDIASAVSAHHYLMLRKDT